MTDSEDFLKHFGIKGMKWGVRKDTPTGASRKTDREAHKDANEFARAKLFYGEGAGTRRKLIKATVEAKSKRDPAYKTAFDHHFANQDLGKRASQARSERRRKDTSSTIGKTTRGVHRKLTGGFGSASLAATAIAGSIVAARKTGADRIVLDAGKTAYRNAVQSPLAKQVKEQILKKWK